jgi:hypothetical protein
MSAGRESAIFALHRRSLRAFSSFSGLGLVFAIALVLSARSTATTISHAGFAYAGTFENIGTRPQWVRYRRHHARWLRQKSQTKLGSA